MSSLPSPSSPPSSPSTLPSSQIWPASLQTLRESRPKIDTIKALLNHTMRISASDGRIFIGTFMCVDKQINIVLANVDEYRIDGPAQGRYVAMVMVPWRLITKVEAQSLAMGLGAIEERQSDVEFLYS